MEPCLNCKCTKRNLICSLRVCSDQPIPPPRGCVLVKKQDVCCSYVTCSKFHLLNNNNGQHQIINQPQRQQPITYDNRYLYKTEVDEQQHRVLSENTLYRRIDNSDDGDEVNGNDHCAF